MELEDPFYQRSARAVGNARVLALKTSAYIISRYIGVIWTKERDTYIEIIL